MSVKYSTQPTITQLKQDIRALAKLPRNQEWLKLSQKLDQLHRRDRAEFQDIIDEGTLNRRTAYYLRDVGVLIRRAKLRTIQAERIGWTKLQIVGEKLDGKNAPRLLKLAEMNNAQELKRKIREDSSKSKPNCVLLYFGTDQYRQFRQALLRHGASKRGRGLIDKEEAIMRIIRLTQRKSSAPS